jgi:hypothetical protein
MRLPAAGRGRDIVPDTRAGAPHGSAVDECEVETYITDGMNRGTYDEGVERLRFALEYGRRHRDLRTISPDEVHASLGRRGFYVYDCNIESLWARAHIPEAIHIGSDELSVDALPADKSATLYSTAPAICASHRIWRPEEHRYSVIGVYLL